MSANQDRFLGTLLGMAIGDALGMPFAGLSSDQIRASVGMVEGYHNLILPDGAEVKAGEFTDESEIALCIVESVTTNQGDLDANNIGARMLFLARGESRRWMKADTLAALDIAESTMNFQVPLDEDGPATGDVAARGIPVGLIHAAGKFNSDALRADSELVTRLTHGSPAAIAGTTAVAFAVQSAARRGTPPGQWAIKTADFLGAGELAERLRMVDRFIAAETARDDALAELGLDAVTPGSVATAFYCANVAGSFEASVLLAVNAGGATDTRAAITGALVGAALGANGIPQHLIDRLESRIYVSLAAPWFHKAALRKAGEVIDLKQAPSGE